MEEKDYVIISLKHTNFRVHPVSFVFWSSDYSGYTEDLEKAGRYSKDELEKLIDDFEKTVSDLSDFFWQICE